MRPCLKEHQQPGGGQGSFVVSRKTTTDQISRLWVSTSYFQCFLSSCRNRTSDPYVYMSHWLIGEANDPSLAHLTLVSYYDLSLQSFVLGCLLYTLHNCPSMESSPSRYQTPPWVMIPSTLYLGRFQTPLSRFQIKYDQFQLIIFSQKLTPTPHTIFSNSINDISIYCCCC